MSRPSSPRSPLALVALTAALALPGAGCLDHPLKQVQAEGAQVGSATVNVVPNRDVDVLFVIDNSGSMAEEQANLAANFDAFVGVLDAVDANYRIAVVTTDNGDPRDPKAIHDAGGMRLSSCRDRLSADGMAGGEFIFDGFNAEFACTDNCSLGDAELEVQPTEIGVGAGGAAPRRWIEKLTGRTNLAEGVDPAAAFACFGPQGINGSGYEAPMEAMYRALAKSEESGSPNFGFLREDAHLLVVFVTDEVDCSFDPKHDAIFQGNHVFWGADDPFATSAVCWRAGVECSGAGPEYGECHAVDRDESGAAGASPADAVLYPVDRYVDLLAKIQADKQGRNPNLLVAVSTINGVPVGYEKGGVSIPYGESADAEDQGLFGVAPGCVAGEALARPPVRLRELAEAFQIGAEPDSYSICQGDYTGALERMAAKLTAKIRPGCVTACVRDVVVETPELDPSCRVTEVQEDGQAAVLEHCEAAGEGWAVPEGVDACFVYRRDPGGVTPEVRDDMSAPSEGASCADEGWNLEIEVLRSAPARSGARIQAECSVDSDAVKGACL